MSNDSGRKVALVFGGSRGIGAAAVRRLAADGFAVAFTYVSRADKAQELADAIVSDGGEAFPMSADSADPAAVREAADRAASRFGRIDVVVVNAGILRVGLVDQVSLDDLDKMLAINVRGVYLSIQAALPHLVDNGRIVTVGSNVAIRTGHQGASVYQMTKGAVAAMVKGLALDLAPRGITVNNVQPGPTDTDINAGAIEALSGLTPLKRVAQPAEIAGMIAYLTGPDTGFVTGASLTIDGGYTL